MSLMSCDEFNSLLDDEEDEYETNNICLISGEELKENHITLSCGHKFNYLQIFNEVKNYKMGKYNLTSSQMKCPYCRNIENKILPYYNMRGVTKIHGVNYPMKYSMMLNTCKVIMKSGKRKGEICGRMCNGKYCNYHKNKK